MSKNMKTIIKTLIIAIITIMTLILFDNHVSAISISCHNSTFTVDVSSNSVLKLAYDLLEAKSIKEFDADNWQLGKTISDTSSQYIVRSY